MQTIIVFDYDELSKIATDMVTRMIQAKPTCVLGLATGSTPIGLYDRLVAAYTQHTVDFSQVKTINLDEYYPIHPENEQSYRYFMNEHLFDHINISKANTYVPHGDTTDVNGECQTYEQIYSDLGGVDLQILGIGKNGHIGFNEPSEQMVEKTHLTNLTQSTIEANARFFDSSEEVPKQAITMGIGTILKAKKILVLASGASKAQAVRNMLYGPMTPMCPASLLQQHPDVVLLCDRSAYSACEE